MEMNWQDPPERSRTSKWKDVAAQLDTRPGTWALLKEYDGDNAKRNAYSLAGRIRTIFGSGYKVTSRSIPGTDEAGVWARTLNDDELIAALAGDDEDDS